MDNITLKIPANRVVEMCHAQIAEITRINEEVNERHIKNQMTWSLFNWFPSKSREIAIKKVKGWGQWDEYIWRTEYYHDILRLETLSRGSYVDVPQNEAWRFKILDKDYKPNV